MKKTETLSSRGSPSRSMTHLLVAKGQGTN
jgi:hypothetical protein